MTSYPDYVHQILARARDQGQWHASQADAAALCFDVLSLFPDCEEARELVYQLFCNEWTVFDNRVAIQQNIEEWDDRPWQHRRRLALSFRFMSRWQGWESEYEDGHEEELNGPADVVKILEDGKMELLGAYCLGDEECTDYAWTIFADAIDKTNNPRLASGDTARTLGQIFQLPIFISLPQIRRTDMPRTIIKKAMQISRHLTGTLLTPMCRLF